MTEKYAPLALALIVKGNKVLANKGYDIKKDKIPLIEPEFEGCFSEFVEISSDNKIYPKEALCFLKEKES